MDRSALDRIIASGGFVSVNTGQAPDAKTIAITHQLAEEAFDAAACIGCGACVATCKMQVQHCLLLQRSLTWLFYHKEKRSEMKEL